MRYCFRHTDALWRVSFWALFTLFILITLWIIASGLRNQPTSVAYAPASQTMAPPANDAGVPADIQHRSAT